MSVLEVEEVAVRKRTSSAVARFMLAFLAAGITLATTLVDHATVRGRSGLGHVGFGAPLVWLRQDQSSLDPSFPMKATFISPWDCPTSLSVAPLMFDGLVVYVLLLAGWFVVRRTGRRFSR